MVVPAEGKPVRVGAGIVSAFDIFEYIVSVGAGLAIAIAMIWAAVGIRRHIPTVEDIDKEKQKR